MVAKRGKKKGGVSVNFDGVEAGGRSLVNGQYLFEVDGVPEVKTSVESGNEYITWVLKVAEGKGKGRKVWHNTSLQPQALWNLRGMLEAMGIEVDEGEMDLELEEFEGVQVGGVVVNEKYEGRDRPRIAEFIAVEDLVDDGEDEDEDEEEEEEAPPPKRGRPTKGKKSAPSFKVGQKVTFEDDDEEFTGKITELGEDVATVKVGKELFEIELTDLTAV